MGTVTLFCGERRRRNAGDRIAKKKQERKIKPRKGKVCERKGRARITANQTDYLSMPGMFSNVFVDYRTVDP